MKDINIKFIKQSEQRYATVGDYWETPTSIEIRVTEFPAAEDWSHLVMVHEVVEKILCLHRGVTDGEIDFFDFNYNAGGEPGDDPRAPYSGEHCFATAVERMLCAALGLDWKPYSDAVTADDKKRRQLEPA